MQYHHSDWMQLPKQAGHTPSHKPWIEKYRPNSLNDVKGQESTIQLFRETLISNRPLHFLLYGPSGTGKTSAVSSFCNELYGAQNMEQYILSINASYERGIDMVRNKIKPFCKRSTTAFLRNNHTINYKIIILDEADTLTKDAQNALRRCIEIYSYNTRFCFMCNYVCNIITPILSRCSVCHFRPVKEPIAMRFLKSVCEKENVHCKSEYLKMVYEKKHGDLRACLTTLQSVHYMSNGNITEEMLHRYLQFIPTTLWTDIAAFQHYKDCSNLATQLYNEGHTVRAILVSLVSWSLRECTDTQLYELSSMVSRIEVQMGVCEKPLLLLLEIITNVWRLTK